MESSFLADAIDGASFGGVPLNSIDFVLLGWFSELSPITASWPWSSCPRVDFLLEEELLSRDQNAQVEPDFGAGSGVASIGGASFATTFPGSSASLATVCGSAGPAAGSSGEGSDSCCGGAPFPDHDHNQELPEAALCLFCSVVCPLGALETSDVACSG